MRGERVTAMNQFADEYYYAAADYHGHRASGWPAKDDGDYDYGGGPQPSASDPSYYYDPGYCGYGAGPYGQQDAYDGSGWSPPGPHDYPAAAAAAAGLCDWPPWDDDRPPLQPLLPPPPPPHQQPLLTHQPPAPGAQQRPEPVQPAGGYGRTADAHGFQPGRGRRADQTDAADQLFSKPRSESE